MYYQRPQRRPKDYYNLYPLQCLLKTQTRAGLATHVFPQTHQRPPLLVGSRLRPMSETGISLWWQMHLEVRCMRGLRAVRLPNLYYLQYLDKPTAFALNNHNPPKMRLNDNH